VTPEQDAANTMLLWMAICVAIVVTGLAIASVVACRKKPRRMATMRGLPRPSKDATRYMKPGSL
jgi:heme/copper-type cytochrome/quinol oxidase subunit 2